MWPIHEHIFLGTSIYEFQGGKPPLENNNASIHLRDNFSSPPSVNYHLEGSSLSTNCPGSSPIGKLPSRGLSLISKLPLLWLISNQATTLSKVHPRLGYHQFVCVLRRGAPLENHSTYIYFWVLKAHPQLSNYPSEGSSPIEQLPAQLYS